MRVIARVPRRSGGIGQSKKVRSVPGRALRVGVEEVIGADVVLVHAPLDETHAQRLGIEVVVLANLRRDRRHMMDT